jgi:hypothetical protein
MNRPFAAIVGALLLAVSTCPAVAQPAAGQPDLPDDWQFRVGTYGWLINLSGSLSGRGHSVDFNASIVDLFQKSSSLAALNGFFEARKGPLGLYGDVVWSKLTVPGSRVSQRNPIAGVQIGATANSQLVMSLTIVEMGGAYEVMRWPGDAGSATAADIYVGGRYWNISNTLTADITGAVDFSRAQFDRFDRSGSVGVIALGTRDWVDPLIGVRVRHQFTPNQDLAVRGDIGGFGISSNGSQFSWHASAIYSYSWQHEGYAIAALGGYRALSSRFAAGPNIGGTLELVIHGPVIGVSVRF